MKERYQYKQRAMSALPLLFFAIFMSGSVFSLLLEIHEPRFTYTIDIVINSAFALLFIFLFLRYMTLSYIVISYDAILINNGFGFSWNKIDIENIDEVHYKELGIQFILDNGNKAYIDYREMHDVTVKRLHSSLDGMFRLGWSNEV